VIFFEWDDYDYLRLFLIIESRATSYVIDNEIIAWWPYYGDCPGSPKKALNLLIELYSAQHGQLTLPNELRRHFAIDESKLPIIGLHDPCLVGYIERGRKHWCLDFSIKINDKERYPVFLYKVKFNDNPLPISVKLSPKETFLALANICSSSFTKMFHIYRINHSADLSTKDKIKQIIDMQYDERRKWTKLNNDKKLRLESKRIHSFVFDYLIFLEKRIIDGSILPFELLKLSGAHVLVELTNVPIVNSFLLKILEEFPFQRKVSYNKKLLCYTLFQILKRKANWLQLHPELEELILLSPLNNSSLLDTLDREINKKALYGYDKR
jgi:hypothetical protein